MKKIILIYIGLIAVVIILALSRFMNFGNLFPSIGGGTTATINNVSFSSTVADDDKERATGLSGKKSLGENEGLIFIFDKKDTYPFWMKEMNFPIDIIYIDSPGKGTDITEGTIVDIIKNAPAPDKDVHIANLPIYKPQKPANVVLEINAGLSDKNNFKIGDKVMFSNL